MFRHRLVCTTHFVFTEFDFTPYPVRMHFSTSTSLFSNTNFFYFILRPRFLIHLLTVKRCRIELSVFFEHTTRCLVYTVTKWKSSTRLFSILWDTNDMLIVPKGIIWHSEDQTLHRKAIFSQAFLKTKSPNSPRRSAAHWKSSMRPYHR